MSREAPERVIECAGVAEWEAWLEAHHATEPEVWLRLAKKGTGVTTVTRARRIEKFVEMLARGERIY